MSNSAKRPLWIGIGGAFLVLYEKFFADQHLAVLAEEGLSTRGGQLALFQMLLTSLVIIVACCVVFVVMEGGALGSLARFPETPTVVVGLWILMATLAFLFGLLDALWRCSASNAVCVQDVQLKVTAWAGGLGSMIATVLAYLKHASEREDFKLSYVPWYLARPLLGILLAVVFYFLLMGGLLALGEAKEGAQLNILGLAGLASLVGMFSKNALQKLRDVFATLFASQADVLERLAETIANHDDIKAMDPKDQETIAHVLKELPKEL